MKKDAEKAELEFKRFQAIMREFYHELSPQDFRKLSKDIVSTATNFKAEAEARKSLSVAASQAGGQASLHEGGGT